MNRPTYGTRFRVWLHRVRSLLQRSAVEEEIDEELRFHLDMEARKLVETGLAPDAARREALRRFGGVEKVKEEIREHRGVGMLEGLQQDLRHGLRVLRTNPGFTAVAVATLALGIGANTAIFSLIHGVLLRPLPYAQGDELVVLRQSGPKADIDNIQFSVKEIQEYREQIDSLSGLVEHHAMTFTLLGRGEPERVSTGVVSADFFEVLGVQPLHGRTFRERDDDLGAEPVLVLSHAYWQRAFGGDPGVVGEVFEMNDRPHTVVGVLPPIPQYPVEHDLYMPTSACPFRARAERVMHENRNAGRMMTVFGRLAPDASVEDARADAATIAGRFVHDHPEVYEEDLGFTATAEPLQEELTRDARPMLLVLLATAGLVLLLACANVANLTLARLMRREREMAARAALGASRGRLVRQLTTEATVLSVLGGAVGLVVAYLGLDFLVAFVARFTPRAVDVSIDGSVLGFTLVISVLTGIVFGSMPALPARADLVRALKEEAGRTTAGSARRRLRSGLIVAQVAISFMLLIGAGLMVRSLWKLQSVDPGFQRDNILTAEIFLNWSKYSSVEGRISPEDAQRLSMEFWRTLLQRMEAHPGVLSATATNQFPVDQSRPGNQELRVEGRSIEADEVLPQADFRVASDGYFRTLGVTLVAGRTFDSRDVSDAPPVTVVNQALARTLFPDREPIGRRISFDDGETWMTIVGVVGDVRQVGLDTLPPEGFYVPMEQAGFATRVMLRTRMDPATLERDLKGTVYEIDPDQAVANVRTLEDIVDDSIASPRITAILLGLFAGLAMLVTVTGISGVIAFTVSQRRREIGIRMALGAERGSVLGLVLRQGMALVAAGLAIGLAGAVLLHRAMADLLFGIEPTDPLTFVVVSALLAGAAALACLLPARRATTVDPMIALRS